MIRMLIGTACAFALVGCNEPTQTNEAPEGSYGASSGPNANDPDATTAGQDQTPTYDEAETATGSEFGEQAPSAPGPNEPDRATATP
jgi:hypothetical protein